MTAGAASPSPAGSMRVLHIAQRLPGGPASYLAEVLPWQVRKLGAQAVMVFAAKHELPLVPDCPPAGRHGFTSTSRRCIPLLMFALFAILTIHRVRPDIVHLHSSFPGALRPLIRLLPGRYRPAVVYCAHGWAFNRKRPEWQKRIYAAMERVLARITQETIAISHFERRSALARSIPATRLRVIENGISAKVHEPGSCDLAAMPSNRLNLLFVGRLDEQKGFDVLEEAMARLETNESLHLHVLGAHVVSENARPPRMLDNITYYGWQDRGAIPGLIEAADVLVMPSRWEGFGLVAIEAMRQGKPVLASAVDALPDVIGDAGKLFPPGDAEALAKLLAGLDRSDLLALGHRARARFLERYTADRMNTAILACYQDALACKPARRATWH